MSQTTPAPKKIGLFIVVSVLVNALAFGGLSFIMEMIFEAVRTNTDLLSPFYIPLVSTVPILLIFILHTGMIRWLQIRGAWRAMGLGVLAWVTAMLGLNVIMPLIQPFISSYAPPDAVMFTLLNYFAFLTAWWLAKRRSLSQVLMTMTGWATALGVWSIYKVYGGFDYQVARLFASTFYSVGFGAIVGVLFALFAYLIATSAPPSQKAKRNAKAKNAVSRLEDTLINTATEPYPQKETHKQRQAES